MRQTGALCDSDRLSAGGQEKTPVRQLVQRAARLAWQYRTFWAAPFIFFALLAGLIVFSGQDAAPFLYSLF